MGTLGFGNGGSLGDWTVGTCCCGNMGLFQQCTFGRKCVDRMTPNAKASRQADGLLLLLLLLLLLFF